MGQLKRRFATVELADGTVHEDIRIIAADTVRYEETAQRNRWPSLVVKDGSGTTPHLDHKERFEIWCALRRLGLYDGKWEQFKDTDLVDFTVEAETADPTQPAPSPD